MNNNNKNNNNMCRIKYYSVSISVSVTMYNTITIFLVFSVSTVFCTSFYAVYVVYVNMYVYNEEEI